MFVCKNPFVCLLLVSPEDEINYPDANLVDSDGTWHFYPSLAHDCAVLSRRGDIEKVNCFQQLPFVCKVEAKNAPYDSHCDVLASGKHLFLFRLSK